MIRALEVKHIPVYHQLVEIFMKSLPYAAISNLRFKLGVFQPPTPSLRGDKNGKSSPQTEGLILNTKASQEQNDNVSGNK